MNSSLMMKTSFFVAVVRELLRMQMLTTTTSMKLRTLTTTMAMADFAAYIAILASIGWVPHAVTTNLNINFLKKPEPRDLLAEARLIKLGKRLAVGEIDIRSEGDDDLVAHATATYSIPPQTVK